MSKTSDFTPDCTNCAALCCLALAFDTGDRFAHDKAAGTPCHNLDGFSCRIHAHLSGKGYGGCVAFDCLGAGQRATALFAQNWRDDPRHTGPMMRAFRTLRDIQDLRQMLHAAKALNLPPAPAKALDRWISELETEEWTLARLEEFDRDGRAQTIRRWLRGLADHVKR